MKLLVERQLTNIIMIILTMTKKHYLHSYSYTDNFDTPSLPL